MKQSTGEGGEAVRLHEEAIALEQLSGQEIGNDRRHVRLGPNLLVVGVDHV